MWLQLIDLLGNPLVIRFPQLRDSVLQSLEQDLAMSIDLNQKSQSNWMWWKNQSLINENNVEIIEQIIVELQKI